jgi:hypothetical protein
MYNLEMESNLEPIYEAYERLKFAQLDGDENRVKIIEEEISELRKKAVEESKWKGSASFYLNKDQINFENYKTRKGK